MSKCLNIAEKSKENNFLNGQRNEGKLKTDENDLPCLFQKNGL